MLLVLAWIVTASAAPCPAGDSDGDLILDVDEDIDQDGDCDNDDNDADGVSNYQDQDDDNDGVDTICEVTAGMNPLSDDSDADGVVDELEFINFTGLPDFNGGYSGTGCYDRWDWDSDGYCSTQGTPTNPALPSPTVPKSCPE